MKAFFIALLTATALNTGLVFGDECKSATGMEQGLIALYPLNGEYNTQEIQFRTPAGQPHGVQLAPGRNGSIDGSYEFFGNPGSYILFQSNGYFDTQYSITMLCWVNPGGRDGPLINYRHRDAWEVHLWVVSGQLFARFTERDFTFTPELQNKVLTPGKWWFVGASYDGPSGDAKLWVNGQLVMTRNIGANLLLATQSDIVMGSKPDDERHFKGRIAQMRIYNF